MLPELLMRQVSLLYHHFLICLEYDDIIVASVIPQFIGPETQKVPSMFKYVDNSKFGNTVGLVGDYGTKGYIIEGGTPKQRAANFKSKLF